jgi:hypothetical protein
MKPIKITLDMALSKLVLGSREVRIESKFGVAFLAALVAASVQQTALSLDVWQTLLNERGLARPDRTGMRRLLQHLEKKFDELGWTGPRPVVLAPVRCTTVGPWRLNNVLSQVLQVKSDESVNSADRLACLVMQPTCDSTTSANATSSAMVLTLLRSFLVADDLARNGMFADAAAAIGKALTHEGLSPEVTCVLRFRKAKFLRRAGQFSRARANLDHVSGLLPKLVAPMLAAIQAELSVQSWRIAYDDVGGVGKPCLSPIATKKVSDFRMSAVDSRLLWQQLNLWASEWRRRMDVSQLDAVQMAFNNSRRGYEAAIFWALVSDDALNVMNIAANMGYLLHLAGQRKLADRSVEALDWLLLSQAYIERFEWPEESLWDHVYLAELYLASKAVRQHIKRSSAYLLHARTPDNDEFYVHALGLGARLGEPRQLADMYQQYVHFLQTTGQGKKAKAQGKLLDALLEQHPGLREKLTPVGFYESS